MVLNKQSGIIYLNKIMHIYTIKDVICMIDKSNIEGDEDMSKLYREKINTSKDTKEYNRKQRDELIEKIVKKHGKVLEKLSKT